MLGKLKKSSKNSTTNECFMDICLLPKTKAMHAKYSNIVSKECTNAIKMHSKLKKQWISCTEELKKFKKKNKLKDDDKKYNICKDILKAVENAIHDIKEEVRYSGLSVDKLSKGTFYTGKNDTLPIEDKKFASSITSIIKVLENFKSIDKEFLLMSSQLLIYMNPNTKIDNLYAICKETNVSKEAFEICKILKDVENLHSKVKDIKIQSKFNSDRNASMLMNEILQEYDFARGSAKSISNDSLKFIKRTNELKVYLSKSSFPNLKSTRVNNPFDPKAISDFTNEIKKIKEKAKKVYGGSTEGFDDRSKESLLRLSSKIAINIFKFIKDRTIFTAYDNIVKDFKTKLKNGKDKLDKLSEQTNNTKKTQNSNLNIEDAKAKATTFFNSNPSPTIDFKNIKPNTEMEISKEIIEAKISNVGKQSIADTLNSISDEVSESEYSADTDKNIYHLALLWKLTKGINDSIGKLYSQFASLYLECSKLLSLFKSNSLKRIGKASPITTIIGGFGWAAGAIGGMLTPVVGLAVLGICACAFMFNLLSTIYRIVQTDKTKEALQKSIGRLLV